MHSHELIAEWIDELVADVNQELEGMSDESLQWHPDQQGNSIGITVWHFSRWFDVLNTQVLQGQDALEEIWHRAGWADRTGYDPHGVGSRGFGAITGYTWKEVEAVPKLSAASLTDYLSEAGSQLAFHLRSMGEEGLHRPAAGMDDDRTGYAWVKSVVRGALGHLGEIQALKAMLARRSG